MSTLPWSGNQLVQLGKYIREGEAPPDRLPPYDEVMMFYNDVAAETQERIKSLDWESLLEGRRFEVTSRPKTIDTLRQKLQRDRATQLPSIQDIAGVRFEAEMTLDEQDAVVTAIVGLFDHDPEIAVKDLRTNPRSGYRAVHIWLRLPARVEVQVRTHLQSEWANMYESLADVLGRDIRYDVLPVDHGARAAVESLQKLSTVTLLELEKLKNSMGESREKVRQMMTWFEDMSPEEKELGRADQLETLEMYQKNVDALASFEAGVRATIAEHKENFDSMRSKGGM